MRTIFYLTRDEYNDIKARGLDLNVGGSVFTILLEQSGKHKLVSENGSEPSKIKSQPKYTEQQKKEIIAFADKNGNPAAQRKYGVSASGINYWRKKGGK